jgi:hypothetical protein
MKRLWMLVLLCSGAAAQQIIVSSYAPPSAWPASCKLLPFSFQVAFTYYVDT